MKMAIPFLLIAVSLLVAGCGRSGSSGSGPDYSAQTDIDGYTVRVDMFHIHPILAEYRKLVTVSRDEKVIISKEFIDAGGMASLYFLRDGAHVTILDGLANGFVLNVTNGAISEIDRDSIPRDFPAKSFGRFMFMYDPNRSYRSYRWLTREELQALTAG